MYSCCGHCRIWLLRPRMWFRFWLFNKMAFPMCSPASWSTICENLSVMINIILWGWVLSMKKIVIKIINCIENYKKHTKAGNKTLCGQGSSSSSSSLSSLGSPISPALPAFPALPILSVLSFFWYFELSKLFQFWNRKLEELGEYLWEEWKN